MMMTTTPSAATTTTEAETTTPASSSGVELSPQPIYQERSPPGNITRINQTYAISTFSGNGTLTLPNTTQTINTAHNGTALISFTTPSGYANQTGLLTLWEWQSGIPLPPATTMEESLSSPTKQQPTN